MRILLDENAPRGLRRMLAGHDVRTVPEMGWSGHANGQLLDEAQRAGFDAIVTSDQNFVTQQSLTGRAIAVIIFSTNRWAAIRAQPQTVQRAIANARPGTFTRTVFRSPRQSRRPPAAGADMLSSTNPRPIFRRSDTVTAGCVAAALRARHHRRSPH